MAAWNGTQHAIALFMLLRPAYLSEICYCVWYVLQLHLSYLTYAILHLQNEHWFQAMQP